MDDRNAQALRERLAALLNHRKADPGNLNLACDVANMHLQLGETAEARRLLEAELANRPRVPVLHFLFSSLLLAERDYAGAENILAVLAEKGHDSLPLRCNRAEALLWLRRPDEVLGLLSPLVERAIELPQLLLLLAKAHLQRQEFKPAIEAAKRYLVMYPLDANAHGLLALLAADSGDHAQASVSASRALGLDPEQLEALLARARVGLARLDGDGVAKDMQQALHRYPTSGAAWSALAQAHLLRMDMPAAEAAIEQALRHMPDHIGTWHLKGWCQIVRGDAAGAKQSFAAAYDLDRNFGETHGGLAVIAAMEGDEQEARAAIKRALRLDPKSMAAQYAESLLLERSGKAEEARSVMQGLIGRQSPVMGMSYGQLAAAQRARLGQG